MDNINLGAVQAPYWEQVLTLEPGELKPVNYIFNSFNLLEASVPDVLEVTFGGAAVESKFSAGMSYKLDAPVYFITFKNTARTPLIIRYSLAVGEVRDSRLTVSGTVNTNSQTAGYARIASGSLTAPQTITYDNQSVVALVCTSGTITINIETTDVSVENLELTAGQSWEMPIVTGGDIVITGTGKFNYTIAGY